MPARWTGTDGSPRTDQVSAPSAAGAGRVVTVWVDRDGGIAAPLMSAVNALAAGILSAVGVLILGGMALVSMWAAVRRMTAARDAACWEREWADVGPEWSRYRR